MQELCQKIIKGVYNTPAHISIEVRDLLARMLTVVPDHRITFDQVCSLGKYACMTNHQWRFHLKQITWAARYYTWLLIKLMPKGVVFSLLFVFFEAHLGIYVNGGAVSNA